MEVLKWHHTIVEKMARTASEYQTDAKMENRSLFQPPTNRLNRSAKNR